MWFSGPTGMSNSSSQFEFMYPKNIVNEPSSFCHHPSYDGDTLSPREYENLVWALEPCWNRRTDNAATVSHRSPGLDTRKRDASTITLSSSLSGVIGLTSRRLLTERDP